jgi:aminoglycoside phosphotransferase (APT) family kinase protein
LHDGNILIDPTTGKITGIIDWECAGFRPWWTGVAGVGWLEEDRERFLFGADRPNNFADDNSNSSKPGSDGYLRAFFRTELHKESERIQKTIYWIFKPVRARKFHASHLQTSIFVLASVWIS